MGRKSGLVLWWKNSEDLFEDLRDCDVIVGQGPSQRLSGTVNVETKRRARQGPNARQRTVTRMFRR